MTIPVARTHYTELTFEFPESSISCICRENMDDVLYKLATVIK